MSVPKNNSSVAVTLSRLKRSTLYSEELGIHLESRSEREFFKWFLASMLFGGRITETIAEHTYQAFVRHGLTTPAAILEAGWDYLVDPIMREGGYVRYDGRKSTQVLRDCQKLVDEYGGAISRVHEVARDSADLEARLRDFWGIGPVTANIFLRELRPYWAKARPAPLPVVETLARRYGIDIDRYRQSSMTFVRIEAGLIRLRRRREAELERRAA